MADYSGGGYTAYVGRHLVLLTHLVFRTRHRYEEKQINQATYLRRMKRLQKSFYDWLNKGTEVLVKRYQGRCKLLLKHKISLWIFLKQDSIPLTNNEAERCLRGFVIQRKISFGTISDAGDKFRSRIHTLIEAQSEDRRCQFWQISSHPLLRKGHTLTFLTLNFKIRLSSNFSERLR